MKTECLEVSRQSFSLLKDAFRKSMNHMSCIDKVQKDSMLMHLASQVVALFRICKEEKPLKVGFLLWFISPIMIPKNVFNRYVAMSWWCFSCQEVCLFSQVSEKHKHRGLSEGVAIPMPSLQSFESGTNLLLFCNQTRYSLSSGKDSPHFMSTRPFKLKN